MNMIINTMFCDLTTTDKDKYICKNCHTTIKIVDQHSEPPLILCKQFLFQNDTVNTENIKNFVQSTEDTRNGYELCSDNQIIQRHNICMGCEFYHNQMCSKCGCSVTNLKTYANKLASKNSECPIGKWGKST